MTFQKKTIGRPKLPDSQKAATNINFRVNRDRKAHWINMAYPQKLTQFITKHIDRITKYNRKSNI